MHQRMLKMVPPGVYPEIPTDNVVIWQAPADMLFNPDMTHLVICGREPDGNNHILTFCTWLQDRRYKREILGTWIIREEILTRQQFRKAIKAAYGRRAG